MGYFGYTYSKSRPTKDRGHEPTTNKQIGRQKDNNTIFQHAVDDIILQDNKKLSAEAEAHENIDDEMYKNGLYDIDNRSLDERKENTELRRREFEIKVENKYDIEIQNSMTCMHGKN